MSGFFSNNINNLYKGLPEYSKEKQSPYRTVYLHFDYESDLKQFICDTGIKIDKNTKYIYYPNHPEIKHVVNKRWVSKIRKNKYPIYIISKGRWESRLTSKALEKMFVPYKIVVEPQEYDNYAAVINPKKILVLPFSNLGQGSIPARNWVWEHAKNLGAERHWILDDNIRDFRRNHKNLRIRFSRGGAVAFKVIEDFVDRYENIYMAGMQYCMFAPDREIQPILTLNTRIYSCILLSNSIYPEFKWRGKYNEDTDLSLRILKSGACTVLFYSMLCRKISTMIMKGGNTDELYKDGCDSRLKMTQSLVDQHPDVVDITYKFGHPHHQVNYTPFKRNKLILKEDMHISDEPNEYTMQFQEKINGKWIDSEF